MIATLKSILFGSVVSGCVAAADSSGFDFKEITALGLVAFMVWRNYENQKTLIRSLETKNKAVEELHIETLKIIRQQTDALERRPCLQKERLGELK